MQRKLPVVLQDILFAAVKHDRPVIDMYGLAVHHSGEGQYSSSGLLSLPRPLDASYTENVYSGDELEDRQELVTANCASFNIAELRLRLAPAPAAAEPTTEPRATSFARSPSRLRGAQG